MRVKQEVIAMTLHLSVPPLFLAIAVFALPGIGAAQDSTLPVRASASMAASKVAPQYTSDQDMARVRNSAFNTPESDGRPGVYYFDLGAQAAKRHDYEHAIAMYKVAGAWAYKPAQYNLGVMYLRGQGSAVDLPRALAWMALAAERKDPQYVKALDLLNRHLDNAQFKQANVIFGHLLPTFGDKVALVRAKARWQEVLASATGSRVGSSAMPLRVGATAGVPNHMSSPNYDVHSGGHISVSAAEVAGIHQIDGAVAYEQLRESKNPYDPKFEWHPDAKGTVTVGPLTPTAKKQESRLSPKPTSNLKSSPVDNPNDR